jgi:PTS system fructose-specific IIA component
MLAVPEKEAGNTHLDLLAKLSRRLIHEDFRNELLNSDADRAYDLLTETLEEK